MDPKNVTWKIRKKIGIVGENILGRKISVKNSSPKIY